ncbi:hypothetical protein TNCT1_17030 [Streptomyces sp. 1-11]|nr:hypothetical protein TNCT1_17030 [Streptomyces sp. 1-11]
MSATASRTSGSAASGAIAVTYRPVSASPYAAQAASAPNGTRRQDTAIRAADRALLRRGGTLQGKSRVPGRASGTTAFGGRSPPNGPAGPPAAGIRVTALPAAGSPGRVRTGAGESRRDAGPATGEGGGYSGARGSGDW